MPLAATITAFYNFSANTKARASQVNANFDVFRGHIIPIDPNTVSSANNTYDLGSSEYVWANIYSTNQYATNQYLNGNQIFGLTTTKQIILQMDGATTAAEAVIKLNNVEKFRINNNGIIANDGRTFGITSSAGLGQMAGSNGWTSSTTYHYTTGSTPMIGSTLTIQSNGRPVRFTFAHFIENSNSALMQIESTSPSNSNFGTRFRFYKNGNHITSVTIQMGQHAVTSTAQAGYFSISPEGIGITDYLAGTTTNTYHIEYISIVSGLLSINGVRTIAYEI